MGLTKEGWKDRAFAMERQRDEAREQVQTLRAALVTVADRAGYHVASVDNLRVIYLAARKALAALEREESQ